MPPTMPTILEAGTPRINSATCPLPVIGHFGLIANTFTLAA